MTNPNTEPVEQVGDRTRPLLLAQASKRGAGDWQDEDAEVVIASLLHQLDRLTATAPLQARVEELLSEVRRLRALAADHFRNSQRLAARVVELEQATDKSV